MYKSFYTYGNMERLFLDSLLQFNVAFIANIKAHLQFGDLNLKFLLDASYLGLESSFGLDNSSTQLFNFNAGLFAVITLQIILLIAKPKKIFPHIQINILIISIIQINIRIYKNYPPFLLTKMS